MSLDPQRRPKVLAVAPLVPVALAVMAGIVVDRYADPCDTRTWGAVALAGGMLALVGLHRRFVVYPALIVAFIALGGGLHHSHWSDLRADDLARGVSESPRPAWVRGVLSDVVGFRPGTGDDDQGTTRAVLAVTAVNDDQRWRPASGRIQMVVKGDRTDLVAGEAVEAAGSLSAIAGPLNPGEFDYRSFMRAQGIRLRLGVDDRSGVWRSPEQGGRPVLRAIRALRAWSHARLIAGLDPAVAPLAAALLLGRREGVDPEVNDAFARTGTTHLLAISGLHLQVLAGALMFGFRLVGLGRRAAFAGVGLATAVYALLVGLTPSVVRSAAMTITVCFAGLRDRETRPANVLALAALMTVMLNPAHLFDVGCQLSFLAVAAILWGVGPVSQLVNFCYYAVTFRHQGPESPLDALERRLEPWWLSRMRRWPPLVTSGVVVSVVVWLVALPLVALRFHIVSPIGVLLNIPLIPLTSLALMASGVSLAVSAIWPLLAAPFARISSTCLTWTESLVRWGATRTWGHAFVAGPAWGWIVGFYALLALATAAGVGHWPRRRWTWVLLAGWIVVGGLRVGLSGPSGPVEAEVLAVGHGLAVVIQTADGRAVLYDCGRMRDPSVGRRIVAPALWARGFSRLDAVILSHADTDHYNGLADLLDRFSINEVCVGPGFGGEANPGAVRLLQDVRARGVKVRTIADGNGWDFAGTRFSVWHPPRTGPGLASDNARSIVLDVESRGRHFLLTGDLEHDGLDRIVTRSHPRLDAFLAPHHGGKTANPERLYSWAEPGLVVVSQRAPGPGTRDALARLDEQGTPLYRTWKRGAVRLRWDDERISVHEFQEVEGQQLASIARNLPAVPFAAGLGRSSAPLLVGTLGFALGLGACFLMAVAEWGAWALVLPGRRMLATGSETGPGEPIETIAGDGVRLAATWYPAAGANGRVLVMIHGFADYTAPPAERIEALNRRGWSVARLDMRGYGRCGGDRASFGGREAGDVRIWLDAIAERVGPQVTVAAWGRSMGAAIAVRAAAEDSRIAALVLDSPLVDLNLALQVWLRRMRLPWPALLARVIAWRARSLARVSLTRPRPIDVAPGVTAPAMIVHGSDDTLVPLADARRLAAAFGRDAVLIDIAGAGHGKVFDVGGPDLFERVAAFLEEVNPQMTWNRSADDAD